ncbi:DUF6350 family protein [Microbacterium sp.]|uniref:cell division protein PerM n=1 Tax=Microbacterium sp. TaxID=51671 RepID=UPI0039E443E2
MNRLLVALLSAVDAVIAAAVGVAAALAPLTVFWVLGFGGSADWGALWPAAVRVWQLGHFVPLHLVLGDEYLAAAGIPAEASRFVLSLAPLGFAAFTAVFAARSGARAARAGAWIVGVASGTVVAAAVAAGLWATSAGTVALVYGWQSLLLPVLVFALPALGGAVVGAWRHGDDGVVDGLRARVSGSPAWAPVPAAAGRALGVAVAGVVGVGALLVAVALVLRGGEVIALYEAAHVDALGATVVTLGQLAYLPTLVVWGAAFAAGPGFAVGAGTAVSPAGTSLGVVPGIPLLGIIPETVSPWMLLLALAIVAVGFLAGWAGRARLVRDGSVRRSAPRLVVLAAVAVLGGAGAALLAVCASGAIGPERLAAVGPAAGPVAFAVGLELAVGAAIALFSPARARRDAEDEPAPVAEPAAPGSAALAPAAPPDDAETRPFPPTGPRFPHDEP